MSEWYCSHASFDEDCLACVHNRLQIAEDELTGIRDNGKCDVDQEMARQGLERLWR